MSKTQSFLMLEDGTLFPGRSFGQSGVRVGEVVFNTAMSGYQEILTDPSYAGQMVTLTAAHIGNTGVNSADMESDRIHCQALIVRDVPRRHSSWRAEESLPDYLVRHRTSGICDLDTRALTMHLRRHGALNGCLVCANDISPDRALAQARACRKMTGLDLASTVSTPTPYAWTEGLVDMALKRGAPSVGRHHVVCFDFGCKKNILRLLAEAGCRVTVVPARCPAAEVLALEPDGVVLSNGPGDPEPLQFALDTIRELLAKRIPLLGICLGHQLLGLAVGARTIKMKFGHHGANHPVKDLDTGRVMISSQNHGFAVDESSLPVGVTATHRSLFDDSLQGIELKGRRAFGFQGHPEASPGPHDLRPVFNKFVASLGTAGSACAIDQP